MNTSVRTVVMIVMFASAHSAVYGVIERPPRTAEERLAYRRRLKNCSWAEKYIAIKKYPQLKDHYSSADVLVWKNRYKAILEVALNDYQFRRVSSDDGSRTVGYWVDMKDWRGNVFPVLYYDKVETVAAVLDHAASKLSAAANRLEPERPGMIAMVGQPAGYNPAITHALRMYTSDLQKNESLRI